MIRIVVALGLGLSPVAAACGQTTHVWTSLHALEHLPADHPLTELITRPELLPILVNGTMFPDGGYSPVTQHAYGETSHWEPFQGVYLDWILANHPPPFTDEGAEHVAFLLGLMAHGLGDQLFDAAYLTRSQALDPGWETTSADSSTDITMAAATHRATVYDAWFPGEVFVDLFDEVGVEVSVSTMNLGQESLRYALNVVGDASEEPDVVAEHEALFPWAAAHMLDADVAGSPSCIGEQLVGYWMVQWERLHGTWDPQTMVLATLPEDGADDHPAGLTGAEGLLHVVFARALVQASVEQSVTLATAGGEPVEVEASLYYGEGSNVLNVAPASPLDGGTTYVLTVEPGVTTIAGDVLEAPITVSFRTAGARACGCQTAAPPAMWMLVLLALGRRVRGRRAPHGRGT